MYKTIQEIFEYVKDTAKNTDDIDLSQYMGFLKMRSNYKKGFAPVFIEGNNHFYYESRHVITGKIYQSNQGYRMLSYSLKHNGNMWEKRSTY